MEKFNGNMVKLSIQMEKSQRGLDDFHMNKAIEILNKPKGKVKQYAFI